MPYDQLLGSLPILGVFLVFVFVGLVAAESGYRLGRWWQNRTPQEKVGPTTMIVGSLLALM